MLVGGPFIDQSSPLPRRQTFRYLSSVTVKQGKVYALFVKTPANVSRGCCWAWRGGGGRGRGKRAPCACWFLGG